MHVGRLRGTSVRKVYTSPQTYEIAADSDSGTIHCNLRCSEQEFQMFPHSRAQMIARQAFSCWPALIVARAHAR